MPVPPQVEDEDLVNADEGIGGDDYYPMDDEVTDDAPAEDLPPPDEDADLAADDDPGMDMKPGAVALTEFHDHLLDLADVIGRMSNTQEHPEVQKYLDKVAAFFDKQTQDLLSLFGKLYPDHPSPAPPAGTDETITKSDGMGESEGSDGGFTVPEEEETDEEKEEKEKINKRLRIKFTKRLNLARAWRDMVRTKRLGKNHVATLTKAADYLEDVASSDGEFTQHHRAAAGYHGSGIRTICKSYTEMESGTAGDLARGGIPGKEEKSLSKNDRARLAEYDKRVPVLLKQYHQALRLQQRAIEGR